MSHGSGTDDDPPAGEATGVPTEVPASASEPGEPSEPQLLMRQKTYRYRQDLDWNDAAAPISVPATTVEPSPPRVASPEAHARTLLGEARRGALVSPAAPIGKTATRPHQIVDRDRELERRVVARLLDSDAIVLALGGGAFSLLR